LGNLGYAVTSYRAQGVTVDISHVLVDASMTRENLYVAMTRGRDANTAYVAIDQPDAVHGVPYPGDDQAATGHSVLYGVLQHVGAELSAHETITVEQDRWGSIAQLAAEYETIAAAAQHDRWAILIRKSGLTTDQAEGVIASDAFGALTAELRRAEANNHDVDSLLPKLVRARGLDDAQDIASVLHHRLARATARPAGSGRKRKTPHLIAGLILEATGPMSKDMREALDQRRDLIETRTGMVLDAAIDSQESWVKALGTVPEDVRSAAMWRRQARIVAAYRDRYQIATGAVFGPKPGSLAQRIDRARAESAVHDIPSRHAIDRPCPVTTIAAPSAARAAL
jgi:hypothetical protein